MVCYSDYGPTVQGYEHDIQDAQAAGIDGFALDVGDYDDPAQLYYNTNILLMYLAAQQLNTGFKLFFSVDMGSSTNAVIDLINTYATWTNTFRYQGLVVVSSFGQLGLNWNSIFLPLAQKGVSVFFIPHFWPNPVGELPTYQEGVSILNTYSNLLSGLFLFGAAGLPYQLAQCNSNYNLAVHQAGKVFMASYTPNYWGCAQYSNGRRYFETDGGEGTILQWNSIIQNQPDWVEIVTWNDFGESTYSSPISDPGLYEGQCTIPHRYCHIGYLALCEYYIAWYKTGQQPPITRDSVFYYYRTHPEDAVASDTNDVPVTLFLGDIADVIYNTVFLTAPAQLLVNSDGTITTNSLPAGISSVRTPFNPGSQWFTLIRGGSNILSIQGPDILSQITNYDFFPASGYAYGPTNLVVLPPTDLKATGR
jgi:glucan endo-1,3-alpha-glucosidase